MTVGNAACAMSKDPDGGDEAMDFPEPESPTLVDDGLLTVPEHWDETSFEHGEYGPDGIPGIEAKFETEKHLIHLMPVEFERSGREERITGTTVDVGSTVFQDEIEERPDVGPKTAFAVYLDYSTFSSREMEFYTITLDADDALAVACWLMNVERAAEIEEIINIHNGTVRDSYLDSDEEALEQLRHREPENCLLSGSPTQSHEMRVPFRYAPLLDDYPESYQEMPAVPQTIEGFEAVISHSAWTDYGLSEETFDQRIEREEEGRYVLPEVVVELIDGRPADHIGVRVL